MSACGGGGAAARPDHGGAGAASAPSSKRRWRLGFEAVLEKEMGRKGVTVKV